MYCLRIVLIVDSSVIPVYFDLLFLLQKKADQIFQYDAFFQASRSIAMGHQKIEATKKLQQNGGIRSEGNI